LLAVLLPLLLFLLPAVLTALVKKVKIDNWLSPVVACYAIGIILGNLHIITLSDTLFNIIAQVTIPFAIPLLLITTNFKHWLKHARPALWSIVLAMIGVFLAAFTTFFLFRYSDNDTITAISMITGSLIGTNANLSAVGIAIQAKPDTFLMASGADVIVGAVFLVYLTAFAKKLYSRILPAYDSEKQNASRYALEERGIHRLSTTQKLHDLGWSFMTASGIAAAAAALSYTLSGRIREDIIIISISLGGILTAIFSKKVRSLHMAEPAGQYLLLIFCIVVGLRADFAAMLHHSSGIIAITAVYYGLSGLYQLILSKIFHIDVDTSIMTTAGTIFGPVFIGQIAASIKNKEVILTGMVTAIIGYALGNFAGIGIAWILERM